MGGVPKYHIDWPLLMAMGGERRTPESYDE
jgi:hypothetical protein